MLNYLKFLRPALFGAVAAVWSVSMANAVEINYLGWYDETIAKVIDDYEAATGNTVNYKNFDSNDQAFNMVRTAPGDWDVIGGDGAWPVRYFAEGLTQEFNPATLKSWPQLYPWFQDFALKTWPGKSANMIIAHPGTWGSYQATVLTTKIPEKLKSWEDLWKPDLAGRVMLTASGNENLAIGALASGVPVQEIYDLDSSAITPVVDRLIALKPNVRKVYLNVDEITSLMQQEDAWVAITWSSAIANMLNLNGIKAEAYAPGGKTIGWVNCLMLSAKTKNKEAALGLIEWIYSAKMRQVRWEALGAGDHVGETNKFFVEQLAAAGGDNALTASRMQMQEAPDFANMVIQKAPKHLEAYADGWNRWLAAQ